MKKVISVLLAVLMVVPMFAMTAFAADYKLDHEEVTIQKGEIFEIGMGGYTYRQNSYSLDPLYWTSDDTETVLTGQSERGRISGLKLGEATVTAHLSGQEYNCKVKVVKDTLTAQDFMIGERSYISYDISAGPMADVFYQKNKNEVYVYDELEGWVTFEENLTTRGVGLGSTKDEVLKALGTVRVDKYTVLDGNANLFKTDTSLEPVEKVSYWLDNGKNNSYSQVFYFDKDGKVIMVVWGGYNTKSSLG